MFVFMSYRELSVKTETVDRMEISSLVWELWLFKV